MENPLATPPGEPAPSALASRERTERVSRSLAQAARRLRFSTTGRRTIPGSYSARREARFDRVLRLASLIVLVIVPSLTALVYYGLLAADQYVAEAKFAVRTGAMSGLDPIASLTGVPSVQVIQDTQVVTDYMRSRALVEHLIAKNALKERYASPRADFWTRLDPDKPIERILKYWERMYDAGIEMPGGIVNLRVRAFSPEDAVALTAAVLRASEDLVNGMNDRARQDSVATADKRFQRAGETLGRARSALELARNSEGILDAPTQARNAFEIIGTLRGRQLELQQQLTAAQRSTSRDAPQLRSIQFQIDAAEKQIVQLQSELTTTAPAVLGGPQALSGAITRLSTFELERQLAEKEYTEAASRLERARAASMVKQIYLTTFVSPVMPEEARYPRRLLRITLVLGSGLAAWVALVGTVTFLRNRS